MPKKKIAKSRKKAFSTGTTYTFKSADKKRKLEVSVQIDEKSDYMAFRVALCEKFEGNKHKTSPKVIPNVPFMAAKWITLKIYQKKGKWWIEELV